MSVFAILALAFFGRPLDAEAAERPAPRLVPRITPTADVVPAWVGSPPQSAFAAGLPPAPAAATGLWGARLGAPVAAPRYEMGERWEEGLREQIFEWLPGETLESVARTLADKTVQIRVSPRRTLLVVRLPLG